MEQIKEKHEAEKKQLQETILTMRNESNKKTKKAVNRKIMEMETEMKFRHRDEVAAFKESQEENNEDGTREGEGEDEDEEMTPEMLLAQMELSDAQTKTNNNNKEQVLHESKKKRNRQKERLAKRKAEMEKQQAEAAEEASHQIDFRKNELDTLEVICNNQKVKQVDIIPDGHCLFNSICDQLKLRHDIPTDYKKLRSEAAEYIRQHPNDFIPFLFDEETMSIRDVNEYTDKIANTPMWGGDLEILALSKVYCCPISVMMAASKSLLINEDGVQPELKLVYYKHVFGTGEHYGSLHDL